MLIHNLSISWSVSRGRDTYGYNICRLDDSISGRRFRCSGGGYDMIGTVFGDWLEETYQDKLRKLAESKKAAQEDCGYSTAGYRKIPDLYGLTINPDGKVTLDGACGIESMRRIAEAIGAEVQWVGNRRGSSTIAYLVSFEHEAWQDRKAA